MGQGNCWARAREGLGVFRAGHAVNYEHAMYYGHSGVRLFRFVYFVFTDWVVFIHKKALEFFL